MPEIVVATNNRGKAEEFRRLLGPEGWTVRTPRDLGLNFEVDESGATYEENARLKAIAASRLACLPALGDDSGIEVAALGGEPGLRSARFAGDGASDAANRARLLEKLASQRDRAACFVCVLVLTAADDEQVFRGEVKGVIVASERGAGGFGYDPIFQPAGQEMTMAELSSAVKDELSHRGRAVQAALPALRALRSASAQRGG
ncbi:MAG: RdgB/HAM1 family non-canonical purine NTP pyrophosphatase [Dehalococcoidia bacterium]